MIFLLNYINHIYHIFMKVKKGKYFFGTAKVGERGQIVIPKEARDMFKIKSGDTVLVMGDKDTGLAVTKTSIMKKFASKVMESFSYENQNRVQSGKNK